MWTWRFLHFNKSRLLGEYISIDSAAVLSKAVILLLFGAMGSGGFVLGRPYFCVVFSGVLFG